VSCVVIIAQLSFFAETSYPTKENIMKKIAIVALLSAFVATPALADNTGRLYMGGDLGGGKF
jgi:hypothetical protein